MKDEQKSRKKLEVLGHGEYRKWLCYYLDFCHKDGHGYLDKQSLGLFTGKLKDKGQRPSQIDEASCAVRLYYRMAERSQAASSAACVL